MTLILCKRTMARPASRSHKLTKIYRFTKYTFIKSSLNKIDISQVHSGSISNTCCQQQQFSQTKQCLPQSYHRRQTCGEERDYDNETRQSCAEFGGHFRQFCIRTTPAPSGENTAIPSENVNLARN